MENSQSDSLALAHIIESSLREFHVAMVLREKLSVRIRGTRTTQIVMFSGG